MRAPERAGGEKGSCLASWAGSSQDRPSLLMGSHSQGLLLCLVPRGDKYPGLQ